MIEVLKTAILQFLWRKKGSSFSPEEVLIQLYPEDWELFIPEMLETLMEMREAGLVRIEPEELNLSKIPLNQIKIWMPSKLI